MLRVPAVWALGGAYFGLKLIRYSLLFWLPYYLHTALGYDEGAAGYLSTSFEVGGIVGAVATGWVSDRWFPERRALLTAPMIFALAFALWLYQAVGDIGMVPNALAMALVGFLLFGPDALISGAAAQDLGGGRAAASAAGIINGLGSIGAILQGSLTATVSATWGWNALFWVFVVLALVSGFALLPLALRRR
jgi:sugar phosphate permease